MVEKFIFLIHCSNFFFFILPHLFFHLSFFHLFFFFLYFTRLGDPFFEEQHSLCTWEDVTTAPGRLLETVRLLLDPATLTIARSDNLDSSLPADPQTPPPTPPPLLSPSSISFELANPVDVNENDQALKPSPMKVKRVTFAPEIVVEHVEADEPVQVVSDPSSNGEPKIVITVSLVELWLSHCGLVLVLLAAVVFNHWLPVDQ